MASKTPVLYRTSPMLRFMPYCLEHHGDGLYAVLNRDYRLVGTGKDPEPQDLIRLSLTPEEAARLSYNGDPDVDKVYLYRGGPYPYQSKAKWEGYQARLQALAEMTFTN